MGGVHWGSFRVLSIGVFNGIITWFPFVVFVSAELKMDVLREREVKDNLERQLVDEQKMRCESLLLFLMHYFFNVFNTRRTVNLYMYIICVGTIAVKSMSLQKRIIYYDEIIRRPCYYYAPHSHARKWKKL